MKVRVGIFGTFRQRFPSYQPSQGMEVELPEGATARDLLTLLDLLESQGAVVIAGGRVLKAEERLQRGVPVNVMQAIDGG
jgi:sulfur carrier protein ThiS